MSTQPVRLQITATSYRWRVISHWNSLSTEIRGNKLVPSFKCAVRKWIIDCNIELG